MFCCTENPAHQGEIVTSICQQPSCIQKQSQLCCSICIRDHHSSHIKQITTLKQILPQLLAVNNLKNYYESLLLNMCTFVEQQFSNEEVVRVALAHNTQNSQGKNRITTDNVGEITQQIMLNLRKISREENKKIKEIQKTLHSQGPHMYQQSQQQITSKISTVGNLPVGSKSGLMKIGTNKLQSVAMTVSQFVGNLDTFCHTMKHPYVSISPDSHTAWKNTQVNGYKLAALSAGSISVDTQNFFYNVKIEKSTSGNILIGLAIPEIVKQKQFLNVYGSVQGTFLLGQNGNDPKSAIIFHHCNNMFNRKQIVGWNFRQGDVVGIGLIRDNDRTFISFRMYHVASNGKIDQQKVVRQFTMPLLLEGKDAQYQRLHFIALMQNVGDSVTMLPLEQ